jgi:von Willebrand factor type A C-terminal domain/von Willebrand factor type A domain
MKRRSVPQPGTTPDGAADEAGLDSRVATGSDSSAGIATRVLAGVLLALVFPWEIVRRIVIRSMPAAARKVRSGTKVASQAAARVARWIGARLAILGPWLDSLARPMGRATGRSWRAIGGAWRLIWHGVSAAARWAGAGLKSAAGPAGILIGWGIGAIKAAGRFAGGAGRAWLWLMRPVGSAVLALLRGAAAMAGALRTIVTAVWRRALWLLRPVGSAIVGLLRGVAAVAGALGRIAAAVARTMSRYVRALNELLGAAVSGVGRLLRPWVALGWRAARATITMLAACCKWMSLRLSGMSRQVWAAACWVSRRLLVPVIRSAGSALGWLIALAVRALLAATAHLGGGLRVLLSGMRNAAAPLVAAIWRVANSAVRFAGRLITATARPVDRALRQLAKRLSRPFLAVGGSVRALRRTLAQGALVAFGTARHQARNTAFAASSRDSDWRAAVTSPDPADGADDQSIPWTFTTASFQNAFMAPGASRVSAVISVTAEDTGSAHSNPDVVELIIVDCSASMGHPWEKIRAARDATRAAVEGLRDGVWFAVVRGAGSAEVVYPQRGGLIQASPGTKRAAARAIGSLQPVGGTAIGRWLTLAADLMSLRPGAIHHAILLTDGKDEDETESELDAALARCEGLFQCDCRGVGTDWAVSELRKISAALLGSLDIIRDPAAMESDFMLMTEAAMARQLEASLRVWTPNHATINFLRQVSPTILDLTSRGRPAGPLNADYPTGAWGSERREYHLSVDVRPGQVGAEMLASRVSVVVQNRIVARALVKAVWTDDETLSTSLSPEVAHYAGQTELARAIQEGLQARREHDEVQATARLGRAVQLAAESGNDAITTLLASVVDVIDAGTGTVRIRKHVELSDEMTLDTRSTKTVRVSQWAASDGGAG